MFKSNPKNLEKILYILENPTFTSSYNSVLKMDDLLNSNNLATLLYHFGLLTFHEYTPPSVLYIIPNIAMRELYYEYFRDFLKENSPSFENVQKIYDITKALSQEGNLEPLISYMQKEILSTFSFREPLQLNEKSLKFLMIMFFKFTPIYYIHSEQEQSASENQGGYSDLILTKQRDEVIYEWMFELKYVKFGDMKLNQKSEKPIELKMVHEHKKVQSALNDGKDQLMKYKPIYEKKYRSKSNSSQMKYAVILFVGKEFVFFEEI